MSLAGYAESPVREAKQHRKDIDGLRSIAVLAVIGFHCNVPGLSGGFVGVDVFFVISGYLICGLIVRDLDRGSFSIARFYERRCKRILPALFAVLMFCIIAAMFIASPHEARQLGESIMAVALSASNVLFYHQGNYFHSGGLLYPLLMTWSLAVEEQFYLAFPLLMLLLYKRSKRHLFAVLAALCALSLFISIYMEFTHPEFNFYMPFTRAWEIGAGTLLAFYEARRPLLRRGPRWRESTLSWVGLALILGCIVFYSPAVRFPGFEAIPPVLGSVLVLAARNGGGNRVLGLPPFVAIGLVSYSLYLWHWPLLSFAAMINPVPAVPANPAILMSFAFAAAIFSYFFIEGPFRARSSRKTSKVLLAYVSCIALCFAFGAVLNYTGGIPQRAPALAKLEQSVEIDRPHPCFSMSEDKSNMGPECVPPLSSVPVVALLGDSHAEALQPEFQQYASAQGYHLLVLAMPSCPPLRGVTRYLADTPQFAAECERFNKRALGIVSGRPDVKVVLLTGSWPMAVEDRFLPVGYPGNPFTSSTEEHATYLLQGIHAEIGALEAAGKQVILVDDNPSLNFNPIDRYRYALLPMRRWIVDWLFGHPAINAFARTAARSETISAASESVRSEMVALARNDPKLRVVDTKSIFCGPADCAFSDGSNLYYTDNNHLSRFGEAKIVSSISLPGALSKAGGGG